jgi:HlyD family secretion protein
MWRILRSRRIQAGIITVAAIAVVAWWPRPVEVDMAEIARGPLVVTLDDEGQTRVRDKFVVTAPVSGELQRIVLEPGDQVTAGRTTLIRIRPAAPVPLDARTRAEAEATVRAVEAVASRAVADRDRLASAATLAERQRERASRLLAGGAISSEELEIREAEARNAAEALRAADFAVAQARHELQAARARLAPGTSVQPLSDVVVRAPIDGVVLQRFQESTRVVLAGEPLLEIGDPQRIEVVTDLLSADAVKVTPGAEVLLEQWGGTMTLTGRVRRVEPAGFTKVSALGVEEQRVNVVIDIVDADEVPLPLGDAYRTDVRIVVWRAADVVKAPTGSLFRRGQQWSVFVVEQGRARIRPVRIGQRNAAEAEVLVGLTPGDQVLLYPPDTIVDGVRVASRPR